MARFLADENFLGDAVTALRAVGHEVAWIRTETPGITDREVLVRAVAEQRILLTFDKDFGELAYRYRLPAGLWHCLVSHHVALARCRSASNQSGFPVPRRLVRPLFSGGGTPPTDAATTRGLLITLRGDPAKPSAFQVLIGGGVAQLPYAHSFYRVMVL